MAFFLFDQQESRVVVKMSPTDIRVVQLHLGVFVFTAGGHVVLTFVLPRMCVRVFEFKNVHTVCIRSLDWPPYPIFRCFQLSAFWVSKHPYVSCLSLRGQPTYLSSLKGGGLLIDDVL